MVVINGDSVVIMLGMIVISNFGSVDDDGFCHNADNVGDNGDDDGASDVGSDGDD